MKNSGLYRTYKFYRYDLLRRLPGGWGRYYHRKFTGLHAKAAFDEALRRSEGKTCIDLGANVGLYTRKMALGARQVIAFEPDPWTCSELRANVADLDNVTIVNAAAGACEKTVFLYRHPRFENNPSLVFNIEFNHCRQEEYLGSERRRSPADRLPPLSRESR